MMKRMNRRIASTLQITPTTSTDPGSNDEHDDEENVANGDADTGEFDQGNNSTSTDTSSSDAGHGSDSIDSAPSSSSSAPATPTESTTAPLVKTTSTASASFGGSFTISAGLDPSASATGNFFGLFDASKKLSLFKKSFQLFQKSFGDSDDSEGGTRRRRRPLLNSGFAHRRMSRRVPRAERFALYARGLTCLKEGSQGETKEDLADETIPGKSL
ncbi:hypothetical protein R3P38DRAFT_3143281 [Favolaschia claudopus]|uniref:Sox C-terminal domain-containing protein n=1 Tax=Favolaschia claudopus TaxID=2862362 RepID=A0AAV9Z3Y1_9AGAR